MLSSWTSEFTNYSLPASEISVFNLNTNFLIAHTLLFITALHPTENIQMVDSRFLNCSKLLYSLAVVPYTSFTPKMRMCQKGLRLKYDEQSVRGNLVWYYQTRTRIPWNEPLISDLWCCVLWFFQTIDSGI